eukprot:COSAG04_NODE_31195_length_258_cov_0.647799_1_plen_81_part_01
MAIFLVVFGVEAYAVQFLRHQICVRDGSNGNICFLDTAVRSSFACHVLPDASSVGISCAAPSPAPSHVRGTQYLGTLFANN